MRRVVRITVLSLSGIALFSLVFSLLAERGLWPSPPAGTLHNVDLAAGLAGGVWLLLLLSRRSQGDPPIEDPTTRRTEAQIRGDF